MPEEGFDLDVAPYISDFYRMRGLAGIVDNPITIDVIEQWERHTYSRYQKWERDLFLDVDRAFRQAQAKVVKFHNGRTKVKTEDNDKENLSGRRNPRI